MRRYRWTLQRRSTLGVYLLIIICHFFSQCPGVPKKAKWNATGRRQNNTLRKIRWRRLLVNIGVISWSLNIQKLIINWISLPANGHIRAMPMPRFLRQYIGPGVIRRPELSGGSCISCPAHLKKTREQAEAVLAKDSAKLFRPICCLVVFILRKKTDQAIIEGRRAVQGEQKMDAYLHLANLSAHQE